MTRYSVRIYTQQADELRGRYVECGKKEIPRMLAYTCRKITGLAP